MTGVQTCALPICPILSVVVPASSDEKVEISIEWGGEVLGSPTKSQIEAVSAEAPVCFVPMQQGDMKWWVPVDNPLSADKDDSTQFSAFAKVNSSKCEPVVMDEQFNSAVTDIFRNEYLSPRSPYTTLQIPDRKSTRLNSSHSSQSRMPSSA